MLETSARLLRLLSLLQTRKDWSGAELAERLGVTDRTVRRDVDKLRGLGYPVHASTGVTGGYQLGAGAALPPLLLDDDEAVAVAIGLRTAAAGAVTGIEETSVRALAKLEQVLPHRLRRRVSTLLDYTVRISVGGGPTVDPAVLTTIAGACRDHERLRLDYTDHHDNPSVRTVEPDRLVNWGRRWYLVAWDTDRADWRTFRVDRITPRTPTGPRFTPRPPPYDDIATYVSRRVSSAAWRHQARVLLHAPAEQITERVNTAVGLVEPVDEQRCVLVTGGNSIDSLAVHLGLLGVDFEILEPPELVEHVRLLGERYRRASSA
ncbi:MAG TPA: YafY family protein [Pseudonocardiaceae bacterium]|jgi:predicted DNA-binding transcriptional regulator YafY|nr:YafY family protein [Pseudonocardiaceae bacterium]